MSDKELFKNYGLTEITFTILKNSEVHNYPKLLFMLQRLGYINNKGLLTDKGREVVSEISSANSNISNEQLEELALELRNIYPPGRKPNTTKSWRGTPVEVVRKLKSFIATYPDVTKEDIVLATKKYVSKTTSTIRRVLPYFIEKNGNSDLYDYILSDRELGNCNFTPDDNDDIFERML